MVKNLRCRPVPFLWDTGVPWSPPALAGLTDEAGNVLADESGQVLQPENVTSNILTDENQNELIEDFSDPHILPLGDNPPA